MRILKFFVFICIAYAVSAFGDSTSILSPTLKSENITKSASTSKSPIRARSFELFKLEGSRSAPTLLLVGGIHGDEAGAYYTTDLFLQHYTITKGSVWVVPVANPHSMFANVRGLYGDMNRKFAQISPKDPDYTNIQQIKELLSHEEIDISMHLHDGSGYWRPTYENKLLNQYRWGNCSVVDQSYLEGTKYGDIESFATQMVADINEHILDPLHTYHVHNTHTKVKHDKEQLRALTFYSLSIGKPALTNEASKELSVPLRVYYHLLAIESLLDQLGIKYKRDFELKPSRVAEILHPPAQVRLEDRITLPLDSIRTMIKYFPLPKGVDPAHFRLESPSRVMGFVKNAKGFMELKYGSRTLSTFVPDWRVYDKSLDSVHMIIDGQERVVAMGSIVYPHRDVEFVPISGYRVNIIGYIQPGESSKQPNEVGVRVSQKDFIPRFSLDKSALVYRAEIYKGEELSGMIMISFGQNKLVDSEPQSPLESNQKQEDSQAQDKHSESMQNKVDKTAKQVSDKTIKMAENLQGKKARVKVRTAFVRLKPSLDSAIIAKAPFGREMEIVEQSGEWVKIHYKFQSSVRNNELQDDESRIRNIDGYVARRLLEILE